MPCSKSTKEARVSQQAKLTVWRAGKEHAIAATAAEWPNYMTIVSASMVEKMNKMMPDLGLQLAPLTDEVPHTIRDRRQAKGRVDLFGGEGQ